MLSFQGKQVIGDRNSNEIEQLPVSLYTVMKLFMFTL